MSLFNTSRRRRPVKSRKLGTVPLAVELLEAREMLSTVQTDYIQFIPAAGIPGGLMGGWTLVPQGTTPEEVKAAYGFGHFDNAHQVLVNNIVFNNGVAGNGTGSTIAIIDAYDDPTIAKDLAAFDSMFGLPGTSTNLPAGNPDSVGTYLKVVDQAGHSPGGQGFQAPKAHNVINPITGQPADVGETALDVEWAHAIAPMATILLVETTNFNQFSDTIPAIQFAAGPGGADVVSMSFGQYPEWHDETKWDGVFQNLQNAQNPTVTFVASTGDNGPGRVPENGPLTTQYPAASPYVLAVGGTTLQLNGNRVETGWVGSGGGVTEFEAKRSIPDVSYDSDPATGFPVYNTYDAPGIPDPNKPGAILQYPWEQVGGTSDAAPQWAGLIAIANQGRVLAGEPRLNSSQTLAMINGLPAGDFNDITVGNSQDSHNRGDPFYVHAPDLHAGPGYDLVTGRGSPKADLIVNGLVGAPAVHFVISQPNNASAGQPFVVNVTAEDGNNNVVAGYAGVVAITSSDARALLPANAALNNGVGAFAVTMLTAGNQTVTATDTAIAAFNGSTQLFMVSPAAASHLTLAAPAQTAAGGPFNVVVTALDQFNNVATGYLGAIHLTSTDPQAALPPNSVLQGGVGNFLVTLKTAGRQTVTGMDAVQNLIVGASNSIAVAPGAFAKFQVLIPANVAPGVPFNFTVTAVDQFGNPIGAYPGIIHFKSNDPLAVLPPNSPLPNGSGVFVATFGSLGNWTITAVDALNVAFNVAPGAPFAVGAVPNVNEIAGDFNHDGNLDLAIVNQALDTVSIELGNGDGSFRAGGIYMVGSSPNAITEADLNGDGNLDLIVANSGVGLANQNAIISVLLGHGDGTFGPAANVVVAGPGMVVDGVAVGDFNKDGKVDVVASFYDGTVASNLGQAAILLGDGHGAFAPAVKYSIWAQKRAAAGGAGIAVADFNHDGNLDIAFSNYESSSISILLGNGDGTFQVGIDPAVGPNPGVGDIVVGDFNGDGNLDIATTRLYTSNHYIAVILGNGDGTFGAATNYYAGPGPAHGLAMGDFNGDGNLDLVTDNVVTGNVEMLLGDGKGAFGIVRNVATGLPGYLPAFDNFNAGAVIVGDFNNDGFGDLGVLNLGSSNLSILLDPPASVTVAVSVTTDAATHFAVSAPITTQAGSVQFTVTALTASNTPATSYNGTIGLTCTDPLAVLPASATLVNGVCTFSGTLKTAGSATISGTDLVNGLCSGTSNSVSVTPATMSGFTIVPPVGDPVGTAAHFSVLAVDMYNNLIAGYSGALHFSSSDSAAVLPGDTTLAGGVGIFSAAFNTLGNQALTVNDTVAASLSGNALVNVSGPAAHFLVDPPNIVAGTPLPITVIAQDAGNNTATDYTGIVHFSSTDGQAALPGDVTLTTGIGTFQVTLKTAGSQTVTATDTATNGITGTSSPISVSAGAATQLVVTVPFISPAGFALGFGVTAEDAYGNIDTSYSGTVHVTSSDGQAVLPLTIALTNGSGTGAATLETAGNQSFSVTDIVNTSMSATSSAVIVTPGHATHLGVTSPGGAQAVGAPVSFTVTALDAYGNTDPSYSGGVHFSSSDLSATLPADSMLANGIGVFTSVFKATGLPTVTATDTVTYLTGTGTVTVSAGAATHFSVAVSIASGVVTAGQQMVVIVTALDSLNNVAAGYSGIVHISSSDSLAALSGNATLMNGTGYFAAMLKTAGTRTITATDTAASSIIGSKSVSVVAGSAVRFLVGAPATATQGSTFGFGLTVYDSYGNLANGYTGILHFSSTGSATLPVNTVMTGSTGTFSATLKTSGLQTITASDTVVTSITGSVTISVSSVAPTIATHYVLLVPTTTTAGSPLVVEVLAEDSLNNVSTTYGGTLHFSSSDSQAALPTDTKLTAGVGYFAAILRSAGQDTISATDAAHSTIFGVTSPIQVNAAPASRLTVVPSVASAVTGTAFNVTVTAYDPSNNIAVNYNGAVHLSSSDSGAALPANATLTNGSGVFSVTLNTAGSQLITATDTVAGTIIGVSAPLATRGLTVTSLTPTTTGFVATFDKPVDASQLNLYDQSGAFGPTDVLLNGPSAPQISFHGSLLVSADSQTVTFVKTSVFNGISFNPATGVLTPGNYTVTFRSASNGFRDMVGMPLDGANNGNPAGSNFVGTFVVAAQPAVVVGVPSFARGPDGTHNINLPNNLSLGIPLNLSAGSGVTSGTFTLQYNSALLNVTAAFVNSSLAGASLVLDAASTPGTAIVDFSSPIPLTNAGVARLGGLVATVPDSAAAAYKAKGLLHFAGAQLNGGAINVAGDDAVELVAYFGDVTGDGTFSGGDAATMSHVATGIDTNAATLTLGGYSAYPLADPVVLSDLNSNGNTDAPDVTLLNSFLAGTPRTQIPAIPAGMVIAPNGPDPSLSLPASLVATPGGTLVVPVNIDTARPDGSSGATEAILALRYDPRFFTVEAADVKLGSLPSHGWQLTAVINEQTGEIGINLFGSDAIQTTAGGSLVTIELHARATAPLGLTGLALVNQVNPTGQRMFRTTVADNQGAFILHPAITDLGTEPGTPGEVTMTPLACAVNTPSAASLVTLAHGSKEVPVVAIDKVFGEVGELLGADGIFAQSEPLATNLAKATTLTGDAVTVQDALVNVLLSQPVLSSGQGDTGGINLDATALSEDLTVDL